MDAAARWPFVLEQLDRGVLKVALERGQIPLEGLLANAQELHEQGRIKQAVELLAPRIDSAPARTGELDEVALALAERIPDDMLVDTTYGRALALFRLGRRDEAEVSSLRAF